jgi:two-component system response regulator RpfG
MANILLLGPDRDQAGDIRSLLRQDGHQVHLLRGIEGWRDTERKLLPEVVIAPAECSDGVLSAADRGTRGFPAPLLFIDTDDEFGRSIHLEDRLVDRLASPFMHEELLARVDALVRVRRVIHREPAQSTHDRAAQTSGLGRRVLALLGTRIPRHEKPLGPYLEVAARVADWADRRDAFEPGHAERVTSLCAMMAEGLRLDDHDSSALLRAAMLHDIGKVALPVEVLHQESPLEESQMRLIRTHPKRGAALLQALDGDDEVAASILYHHERPDGRGYYGLGAEEVPRTARILAVAEVYDAMTNCRVRKRLSSDRALGLLRSSRDESLDGECVDALVDKLKPHPTTIPLAPRPV